MPGGPPPEPAEPEPGVVVVVVGTAVWSAVSTTAGIDCAARWARGCVVTAGTERQHRGNSDRGDQQSSAAGPEFAGRVRAGRGQRQPPTIEARMDTSSGAKMARA